MSREEILKKALKSENSLILELTTGTGKTRIAIEVLKKYNPDTILLLVPRLVLIENWKEELKKWDAEYLIPRITFSTYVGMRKHKNKSFTFVVGDEFHRLTEANKEVIESISFDKGIALSATLPKKQLQYCRELFQRSTHISLSLKEAVQEEILPEIDYIRMPLKLSDIEGSFIYSSPLRKGLDEVTVDAQGYYNMLNRDIDKCDGLFRKTGFFKYDNLKKNLLKRRLVFLASLKTPLFRKIIEPYKNYRTLTFCADIAQCDAIGGYSIHSKNKQSAETLQKFNDMKIKHITSVGMLNEGVNLSSCKVGVFLYLSSSEITVVQRLGRMLRHKHPIVILPYFIDTREEEIVNKMIREN